MVSLNGICFVCVSYHSALLYIYIYIYIYYKKYIYLLRQKKLISLY